MNWQGTWWLWGVRYGGKDIVFILPGLLVNIRLLETAMDAYLNPVLAEGRAPYFLRFAA